MRKGFSLEYKLVLLIAPLFLAYTLAQYFLFNTTVLESFQELEKQDSSRFLGAINGTLEREVKAVEQLCRDWAIWDDTYAFAVNSNEEYLASNLYASYVASTEIHLFVVINNAGELVYGSAFEPVSGETISLEEVGLPSSFREDLFGKLFENKEAIDVSVSGYMQTQQGLMIVSAMPILTSNSLGPHKGVLVMGRLMDEDSQMRLEAQTGISFELIPINGSSENVEFGSLVPVFSLGESTKVIATVDQLHIYQRYESVFDNPLFFVHVRYPRSIMNQGIETTELILLQSVSVGLLILLGLWLGTRLLIVSPLLNISAKMTKMGAGVKGVERLQVKRADEIGLLAKNFDQLLDRISEQSKQLESANCSLLKMANTDSVSNLPNRRSFDWQLSLEIAALESLSDDKDSAQSLSLLLCDIDFFKQYNDTYGHLEGDNCLKQVANVIRACAAREGDFAARFGGEEFAKILPGTTLKEALALADEVRLAVGELSIEHAGSSVSPFVSISIGVATMQANDGLSATSFLSLADKALYQAKERGRNCIHSATDSED